MKDLLEFILPLIFCATAAGLGTLTMYFTKPRFQSATLANCFFAFFTLCLAGMIYSTWGLMKHLIPGN